MPPSMTRSSRTLAFLSTLDGWAPFSACWVAPSLPAHPIPLPHLPAHTRKTTALTTQSRGEAKCRPPPPPTMPKAPTSERFLDVDEGLWLCVLTKEDAYIQIQLRCRYTHSLHKWFWINIRSATDRRPAWCVHRLRPTVAWTSSGNPVT